MQQRSGERESNGCDREHEFRCNERHRGRRRSGPRRSDGLEFGVIGHGVERRCGRGRRRRDAHAFGVHPDEQCDSKYGNDPGRAHLQRRGRVAATCVDGVPDGTKSFAIVFRDLSNNLLHASLWDVPAAVTALPMALPEVALPPEPAGVKQSKGYNGMYGYQGPCPPNEHSYAFVLYALDVALLPNVTTTSKIADIVSVLEAHAIGTAQLQASFKP